MDISNDFVEDIRKILEAENIINVEIQDLRETIRLLVEAFNEITKEYKSLNEEHATFVVELQQSKEQLINILMFLQKTCFCVT